MTKAGNVITPQEKEDLFLQFFHSHLSYLIYICKLVTSEDEYIDRHRLESSLTNSLTLMWQIHVTASTLKTYYKKVNYEHGTNLIFNQEQSKLVLPKLQEMILIIENDRTLKQFNKGYCLSLLEQTQYYYEQSKYVIVDASLHADPWLESSIRPQH